MKVLSGHVVTKSQSEDSMDLLIMPPSDVHNSMGLPLLKQTCESKLTNSSHTDNINRKRWRKLLQRVHRKQMDTACDTQLQRKTLFGQALSDVCETNGNPPKPIMEILLVLYRKGHYTEGVFRKAGNAKALKEIKEQLNNGVEVDLKNKPVILLADLLKDFLRHLPGSLLMVDQYQAWMAAMQKEGLNEKCTELQFVINTIPEPNVILLKHLIVVLYHISTNSDRNKMDSSNLSVCISPNLLQTDIEVLRNVTELTKFLIDNCCEIFGEDVLTILGDPDEDELSDKHDSLSSLHHDSAYDSNDPDADGRSKKNGTALGEATKKRSQSMKAPKSRTEISFSRGGMNKRAQKALRHSQTLPELLPLNRTFLVSQKQRRVSSEEVFQQVDSRILSNPPSYEQAIQDNAHVALSLWHPLTVDAASHYRGEALTPSIDNESEMNLNPSAPRLQSSVSQATTKAGSV
ncbi:hypothetical protein HF521_021476 [Silurus meridionalis]|uniref:Rho-GAP domain-containing protein n=1 Tax=Silurus meridionalis TaxID=175797 RepID=A0A8T0BBF5_SILME|nr:hypothetical protein HF521_021476 [Silurus meridionalis]